MRGPADPVTRVFLCGPMAGPDILHILLGGEAVAVKSARVAGFALPGGAEACFPIAARQEGAELPGVVLDGVSDTGLARLAFFHAGLRARPVPADSTLGPVSIFAAKGEAGPGQGAWEGALWAARWKDIARNAVGEAMSLTGRIGGGGLAARMPMILARAAARVAAAAGKPAHVRSPVEAGRVAVARQSAPHAGFFVTRRYDLRHPTFGGGMSPLVRREVFVATDAAIVLPYDARRDRVLLVEQFRMGPFGRGDRRPWMLEPVAGRVDAGESPEQTARRECTEEAGLHLTGLEHISSHYCSPGCSTEYFHLYLGLCDLPEATQGQGGLDSEHEDIRTHILAFDRAMELLHSGEADNGPLVLSLIWLQRERARLRAAA